MKLLVILLVSFLHSSVFASEIKFIWKKNSSIKQYRVQVSSDESMNKLLVNKVISKNSIKLIKIKEKPYFIRVSSLDQHGQEGDFSRPFKFSASSKKFIKIKAPPISFYKFDYYVKDGDTFSTILKKFSIQNAYIRSTDLTTKKNITSNIHIKDWRKLIPNTNITLYVDKRIADQKAIKAYRYLEEKYSAGRPIIIRGDNGKVLDAFTVPKYAELKVYGENQKFYAKYTSKIKNKSFTSVVELKSKRTKHTHKFKAKDGKKYSETLDIYYPNYKREIASIKSTYNQKRKSNLSFDSSFALGALGVSKESDSSSLSMLFSKLSGKVNYLYKNEYLLSASIGGANFRNIEYSEASGNISSNALYPEIGFSAGKKFSHFSGALSYDILNYFVIGRSDDSFQFEPNKIHRLSAKSFIPLKYRLGAFGSLGFIKNLGATEISGFDLSVGINYRFEKFNKLSVSGVYYYSSLDVSGEGESSNASVFSLNYGF